MEESTVAKTAKSTDSPGRSEILSVNSKKFASCPCQEIEAPRQSPTLYRLTLIFQRRHSQEFQPIQNHQRRFEEQRPGYEPMEECLVEFLKQALPANTFDWLDDEPDETMAWLEWEGFVLLPTAANRSATCRSLCSANPSQAVV
jgi:hypothetical protein